MPPRKSTNRSSSRQTTTSTKSDTVLGLERRVFNIVAIVVAVLLGLYVAFGIYLYLAAPTSGLVRFVTGLFFYPATFEAVPHYTWWFILSVVMTLLLILSGLKLVWLAVTQRWNDRAKLITTLFVFVAAAVSFASVPTPSEAIVSYHSYLSRLKTLQHFQDKQQQASAQQGQPAQQLGGDTIKAQALQQLVINNLTRQEARKYNVEVSHKEINDLYKQQADQNQGEENLRKQLKDLLGWKPSDFKKEIRLKIAQQKLNEKLSQDEKLNKDRKQKAEDLLRQVKVEKKDFAEVAKQSDDPTSQSGGDQGFVKKGETDPAIENAAFQLNNGDVSNVIKTQNGYVIIKVEEKQTDQVHLREIVVRTRSVNEVFSNDIKHTKVWIWVKNLLWNKTAYTVEPKHKSSQTIPTPGGSSAPAASPEASAVPQNTGP